MYSITPAWVMPSASLSVDHIFMLADLTDLTVFHDDYHIGIDDGREPVSDDKTGPSLEKILDRFLYRVSATPLASPP